MALHVETPEKTVVKKLQFLGEQDGRPERILKDKLIKLFDFGGEIDSAYLAQVNLGNRVETSVALCLRATDDVRENVLNYVDAAFSNLFSTNEHLDIIFLNDVQEVQLRSVCQPFFIRK